MKLLALTAGLILFVFPVLAQSPTPTAAPRAREIRSQVKTEIKSLRDATREEIDARKEEFRALQEQRKEEFKTRLEEAKTKARQEVDAKREELKNRLQDIRDEQKKKRVEKLEKELNELNERMTNHFSEVLNKLDKVLVNIKSRTDKAEAKGLDVSSVRTMIKSDEEAIAAARAAVAAQAGKTYTPQITGVEGKLKVEVGQARQTLHRDLAAVREKVKAAREAVRKAATALSQIRGVNDGTSPSPTVTPTPTGSPSPIPTP